MIYIGADHAGHKMKKDLKRFLEKQLNLEYKDLGADEYVETDDAHDFALAVANKVVENKNNRGILICGTGHGMCISANKVKGIRAISGFNIDAAELGRRHNDANIICLAGRILTKDHSEAIIKKFLETEFENEKRLVRRLNKLEQTENENFK